VYAVSVDKIKFLYLNSTAFVGVSDAHLWAHVKLAARNVDQRELGRAQC